MKFKVGDIVGSSAAWYPEYRWRVDKVHINGDLTLFFLNDSTSHLIEFRETHVLFVDTNHVCQHEWKRLDLFRTTEFCCTKCPATRPFDKERDAA